MTDLLRAGSDWLEDQRSDHMTRLVTYQRSSSEVEVKATIGRFVFRIDTAYNLNQRHESRDYLILAADLVLDTVQVLPKGGDKVLEVEGSTTYTYEVMAPGGEPVFRYSDPYRKTLRIHTKLVAKE